MIRVVKQLCINSPSILEGELWENLSFATAFHITSFHVPRAAGATYHLPAICLAVFGGSEAGVLLENL